MTEKKDKLLEAASVLPKDPEDALRQIEAIRVDAQERGDPAEAGMAASIMTLGIALLINTPESVLGGSDAVLDTTRTVAKVELGECSFCSTRGTIFGFRSDFCACITCLGKWAQLLRTSPTHLSALYGIEPVQLAELWLSPLDERYGTDASLEIAWTFLEMHKDAAAIAVAARVIVSSSNSDVMASAATVLDANGKCDVMALKAILLAEKH
jgi:hypothetical protein